MKQTFGTKDEELQDRMLKQAADVVPDFAGRELKTFDQIASALRGIAARVACGIKWLLTSALDWRHILHFPIRNFLIPSTLLPRF